MAKRKRFAILCSLVTAMSLISALMPSLVAYAQTQVELTAMAGTEYETADAQLNTVYKALREALKEEPERWKKVQAAQKAWIGYRDLMAEAECSHMEGGSAQPMLRFGALTTLTEEQTKHLKDLLND